MKIPSGKWLTHRGQLFAILKSFDHSQLLEESGAQLPTELLNYMKEQKIINCQAPVDFILEENMSITKVERRNDV